MLQKHFSNVFTAISQVCSTGSLLILTLTAPGLALPQNSNSDLLEQPSSQTASDLGEPLEMTCEIATLRGLTLFYATVDGEQVPVDCLSLLRSPGLEIPFTGRNREELDEVEDEIDTNLNSQPAPSTQLLLIEF